MKNYAKFGGMIATSTVVMFIFTYLTTFELGHVYFSETRLYMSLLMGATMAVIMLTFMLHMLKNRRVNIGILVVSIVVFSLTLFLVRSQTTVDDVSYMKAMIPHHSIAILTSGRANIEDPRVRELADEIIAAQRREIEEMKMLIADLQGQDNDPEPAEPETPDDPSSHDDEEINAPPMVLASGPLVVDGSATDYPGESFEAMGITIHMAYYGDLCYIYLETVTDGWLSAGLNTSGGGMNGAMMILGYMEGDSPAYREDLGSSRTHSAVDTPALDQFYFEYSDGQVVMEFSYPLVFPSGKGYNVESLEPGQTYSLILAAHNDSYDITMMHDSLVHFDFTVEP